MTLYIYHVSVHNQDALCPDVHTVTALSIFQHSGEYSRHHLIFAVGSRRLRKRSKLSGIHTPVSLK